MGEDLIEQHLLTLLRSAPGQWFRTPDLVDWLRPNGADGYLARKTIDRMVREGSVEQTVRRVEGTHGMRMIRVRS